MPSGRDSEPRLADVRKVASFRLALRRFHSLSDRATRRCGLTSRQYLLLLASQAAGGNRGQLTVGELVTALALTHGTVTELLDRAEGAGLVERNVDSADRRVAHVHATPEGRRRFAAAFGALAEERGALAAAAGDLQPQFE